MIIGLTVLRTLFFSLINITYNIYLLYSNNHICYSYEKKEYELHCFNYILTNSIIIIPISYFFIDYYYLSNDNEIYFNKCLFFLGLRETLYRFFEKEIGKMNMNYLIMKTPSTIFYSVDLNLFFNYVLPIILYCIKISLNCISLYFIIFIMIFKIHRLTILKMIYNCFSYIYFAFFPTSKYSLNKILKYDSDSESELEGEKISKEIPLNECTFSLKMERNNTLGSFLNKDKIEEVITSPTKSDSDNESFIFIE